MPEIGIDWEALDRLEPLERARAAMRLLEEIPGIQARIAQVRGTAVADLKTMLQGSTAAVAEALGVTPARVGQLIGDGSRPDGIKPGLLRQGLTLALEYGDLLPGDDRKVTDALAALGRPGRRSETEARGIATRLASIRTSTVNTDAMTETEKRAWLRAVAHAFEVMHGQQPRSDSR